MVTYTTNIMIDRITGKEVKELVFNKGSDSATLYNELLAAGIKCYGSCDDKQTILNLDVNEKQDPVPIVEKSVYVERDYRKKLLIEIDKATTVDELKEVIKKLI